MFYLLIVQQCVFDLSFMYISSHFLCQFFSTLMLGSLCFMFCTDFFISFLSHVGNCVWRQFECGCVKFCWFLERYSAGRSSDTLVVALAILLSNPSFRKTTPFASTGPIRTQFFPGNVNEQWQDVRAGCRVLMQSEFLNEPLEKEMEELGWPAGLRILLHFTWCRYSVRAISQADLL